MPNHPRVSVIARDGDAYIWRVFNVPPLINHFGSQQGNYRIPDELLPDESLPIRETLFGFKLTFSAKTGSLIPVKKIFFPYMRDGTIYVHYVPTAQNTDLHFSSLERSSPGISDWLWVAETEWYRLANSLGLISGVSPPRGIIPSSTAALNGDMVGYNPSWSWMTEQSFTAPCDVRMDNITSHITCGFQPKGLYVSPTRFRLEYSRSGDIHNPVLIRGGEAFIVRGNSSYRESKPLGPFSTLADASVDGAEPWMTELPMSWEPWVRLSNTLKLGDLLDGWFNDLDDLLEGVSLPSIELRYNLLTTHPALFQMLGNPTIDQWDDIADQIGKWKLEVDVARAVSFSLPDLLNEGVSGGLTAISDFVEGLRSTFRDWSDNVLSSITFDRYLAMLEDKAGAVLLEGVSNALIMVPEPPPGTEFVGPTFNNPVYVSEVGTKYNANLVGSILLGSGTYLSGKSTQSEVIPTGIGTEMLHLPLIHRVSKFDPDASPAGFEGVRYFRDSPIVIEASNPEPNEFHFMVYVEFAGGNDQSLGNTLTDALSALAARIQPVVGHATTWDYSFGTNTIQLLRTLVGAGVNTGLGGALAGSALGPKGAVAGAGIGFVVGLIVAATDRDGIKNVQYNILEDITEVVDAYDSLNTSLEDGLDLLFLSLLNDTSFHNVPTIELLFSVPKGTVVVGDRGVEWGKVITVIGLSISLGMTIRSTYRYFWDPNAVNPHTNEKGYWRDRVHTRAFLPAIVASTLGATVGGAISLIRPNPPDIYKSIDQLAAMLSAHGVEMENQSWLLSGLILPALGYHLVSGEWDHDSPWLTIEDLTEIVTRGDLRHELQMLFGKLKSEISPLRRV